MMKKLIRFATMALLLAVPLSSRATTDTLVVADGTVTHDHMPIYGFYADAAQHNQIIYPASMLTEMVGQNITSLKFFVTGDWYTPSATISMAIVPDSTLSGLRSGDELTTVWSGYWDENTVMSFGNAFPYTGGNLLIDIVTAEGDYDYSTASGINMGRNVSVLNYYSNNYTYSFLPKAEFIFSDEAFCFQPSGLTATSITPTEITLQWTAGGTETEWDLMINDSIIPDLATTTYTFSNLSPSTRYSFSLRAICGPGDTSTWTVPQVYNTLCMGITQLPWSTGFEGENQNETPLCWTLVHPLVVLDWNYDTVTYPAVNVDTYSSHGGSSYLYYDYETYYGVSDAGPAVLATPYFNHDPADLHVTFWAQCSSSQSGSLLEAGVITDPSDETTFIPVLSLSEMEYGYNQYEFYTSSLADSLIGIDSACIAFRMTASNNTSYLSYYIDDLIVDAMGDCLPPLLNSGIIDSVNYESVLLGWQAEGESSNFDVKLGHYNDQYQMVWQHFTADDDSLYIESGLIPDTYYEAYVATVCDDDTTNYVLIGSFNTLIRCYPVMNATVAALTTNAAALTWEFVNGGIEAASVDIELFDATDSTLVSTVNALGTSYTFTGLTENHLYNATFHTLCGDEDTSAAVTVSFTPHAAPCAEVGGTSTDNYVPFYSYYNNGFSEMLYSTTDIEGIDTVIGLAFQIANPLNRDNIIDIWMGYTNASALNTSNLVSIDSMTHVVANYSFSSANAGWMEMISFDTAFVTDPTHTGNLVIAVYNHTGSWSSGLGWGVHESPIGTSWYVYTDNAIDPQNPTATGTTNSTTYAANVQFYGNCGSGDCLAPSAQVVSTDTTSIELTWLPGGSESEWTIQYRLPSATNWTTAGSSLTTEFFVTNLNPGTEYTIRVGAVCGDSVVYGSPIMAHTLCGVSAVPISITPTGENFCWTYTGSGYYSSYGNYYYIYSGGAIISPRIANSINTLQVRMSNYGAPFKVGVCDANGDSVTWIQTVTPDYEYSTFTEKKVYLNHYTGNQHHIIIQASPDYDYSYFDHITIEPLDDCMPVDSLQLDSVTTTDAWLSWVSDGDNFEIKYLRESDTTNTWQTTTSTTNSVHLTGLSANDRYQIKVFNICSATSVSDSATLRIASGCSPYTVPFSEQFGHSELPVCWNTASTGSLDYSFEEIASYGYTYIYSEAAYNSASTEWLMTPPIQIPTDANYTKLVYLVGGGAYPYSGYANTYGIYDLLISTNGYGDTNNYTTVLLTDTLNSRTTSGVTADYARIALAPYAGQVVSFAFRARCRNYGAVYISDVQVRNTSLPMYYVFGSTDAYAGDTTVFRAEYQEGDTNSMVLAWYSRMAAAGQATILPSTNDELNIIYTAEGVDSLSFTATNAYGADTITWNVNVFNCEGINDFPFQEGFEVNNACWQKVYGDNDPSINPIILVDNSNLSYNLDSVYEGNYCIRFSSYSNSSNYNQYLISPLLHGTNRTVSFHYAMYGTGDYLWFGTSTTTRDTAAFTWTPISNSSTWAAYSDSIADNVKYIAFRYYGDYAFYVYVDDLNITGTASQLTCDGPASIAATVTETTATISFIADAGNYEVAIAENWDAAAVTPVAITDTFYTFSGLTAATQYTVGVRTICNATLHSEWVTTTVTTDEHPCFTPSAATTDDVTYTSAVLSWTPGEAETEWELHVTGPNYDTTISVSTNPYTLTGLASGTEYSFTVKALCSATQQSDASEAQTFTTLTCQPVSGVTANDITVSGATISWTAPTGVDNFEIEYGLSGFGQGAGTRVTVSGTSYTLAGLAEATMYDVLVRSVCATGVYSDWSSRASFETLDGGSQEGIEDIANAHIALYPNPATTTVTLTGFDGQATVTIVDMNGRAKGEYIANNNTLTIDLTGYAQGAYFVRITGEQVNAIRKLIVK